MNKKSILIIDDVEDLLPIISMYATMSGLNAYTLNHPDKILEFLEKNEVDYILTDYYMEKSNREPMNGLDVVQMVNEKYPNKYKFILMSGSPVTELQEINDTNSHLFHGYLKKLFKKEELKNVISKIAA